MAGITEKRLREILKDELKKSLDKYEEARLQTWKNKEDILVMQTEKKTIKWGVLALYGTVCTTCSFIASFAGFLVALKTLMGGK